MHSCSLYIKLLSADLETKSDFLVNPNGGGNRELFHRPNVWYNLCHVQKSFLFSPSLHFLYTELNRYRCCYSVIQTYEWNTWSKPRFWYLGMTACFFLGFPPFPSSTQPPVLLGENPPPYSPLTSPESGSAPVISCRVCQSLISVEGKIHQHVVKCGVCNEATVSWDVFAHALNFTISFSILVYHVPVCSYEILIIWHDLFQCK